MFIVDTALAEREAHDNPVQVGIVGAGYMGRGIALQIERYIAGMRVAAIANRTLEKAYKGYAQAGVEDARSVSSLADMERAIKHRQYVVTDKAELVARADPVDVIIEATGTVEFASSIVLRAIQQGKHVVLMNAELDATVGPILKTYADKAGVVISNADGDQPGVVMNLYRFVETIGYQPIVVGNIKGMLDHYRTPTTQAEFARAHNQDTKMITAFADGTKLAMEQAVIANATGHSVLQRGMLGPACDHVQEATDVFPLEQFKEQGGGVDYILGAEPGPGVFVVGYNDHPILRQYGTVFKMGQGPYYVLYVPQHLPHLESPLTAARAVLFNDATIAPKRGPVCEVITVAKRPLEKGGVLDGIGGYTCYGVVDDALNAWKQDFLPMGLSHGGVLKRDVKKDEPIRRTDIELNEDRLASKLWLEQRRYFDDKG